MRPSCAAEWLCAMSGGRKRAVCTQAPGTLQSLTTIVVSPVMCAYLPTINTSVVSFGRLAMQSTSQQSMTFTAVLSTVNTTR